MPGLAAYHSCLTQLTVLNIFIIRVVILKTQLECILQFCKSNTEFSLTPTVSMTKLIKYLK